MARYTSLAGASLVTEITFSQRGSIAARDLRFVAGRGDDVADQPEHAVRLRRPVRRAAEPHDHQLLAGDDDHILPDRPLGEKGVARPAKLAAVIRAHAVAEIGPEAGAH